MWRKMLEEIASTGMSETAIAKLLGCGQATVWRMRNGVAENPSWKLGEAIIALHAARCGVVTISNDETEAA